MRSLLLFGAIIAGLVLVLTYFLVQGTTIDTPRRERADALQAVVLHNAALQRDVLLARAGLLPSYDPLVTSMENLRAAAAALSGTAEIASGNARADFEQKIGAIIQAVRDQEMFVEGFKAENALLQNSLSYFNHLSGGLTSDDSRRDADVKAKVGLLTTAMLRFINTPNPDAAGEVAASLDRLERLADPAPDDDVRSLVSHARLIIATLPEVDDRVASLQAAPTRELARALQDAFLEVQARAATRADIFMILLYVAALGLVTWIAHLFVRLRANARILRTRLEFEGLIAAISSQFVNLPRDQIRDAVGRALAQLAAHLNVSGARIVVFRGAEADSAASYSHENAGAGAPMSSERMLQLVRHWVAKGYERQTGCLHIADVAALPDGSEKAELLSAGIRAMLCIPMRVAGECLGALVLHNGATRQWHDDDIALLRTAAEIFANAIARERSETEREDLQTRLNRSQRLEAIGTLAGGVAHEFNNILGVVRGYGEMALAVLKESRARTYVQQIVKAGERAHDIVEQILAFGRRRDREYGPVAIRPVIAEAVELLRASFPSTLSLQTDLAAGDATVAGDATELQQVVMNLCTNAAQAMDRHGRVRIGLESIASKRPLDLSHGGLPAGRYARLSVGDTGCGIDDAIMERMFEPFFTTKPAGEGTGLGLSTVHGIVNAHRGAIHVQSRRGKGTTFTIYFPLIEGTATEEKAIETPVRTGHGETVLIVDDDRPLVLLGEDMLAALGYEPVGFDRSHAAFAAFCADPARFDLVLADEIMPGATGTELASAMHAIRQDIPIVLMTGYDRALRSDHLQTAGIREVLKKPLLSGDLAACLARHLPTR